MRKSVAIVAIMGCICLCSGCAALWQSMAYTDDMYSIHNRTAIAERQRAEAELARAQYEAQQAQYAAINAGIAAAETSIYDYNSVLADTYESAYARRLYGFSSPTYRVPSSYYTWRYSDAFHYASAYDPAFYNIMVSGDMVWVEPKYITSMFGSWGAVAIPAYGWYYGWNDPFYYWSTPYRWSCNFYWNYWYSPYLWSWSLPYYHYHPHRPSHHRPPQHRPPHTSHGGVGSTGHMHNRPGMIVGRNPGAAVPTDRGGSVRPSQPVNNGNVTRPSQPVNRGEVTRPTQPANGGSINRPMQPANGGNINRPTPPVNKGSVTRPSQPANNPVVTPRYRNNTPSTSNSGSSSYRGGSSSYDRAPSYNNSRGGSYGGGSHGAPSHGGGGSSRGR